MGEKDIEEKVLEDYNDVFADIINVLIFNGEQVVRQEQLENSKDKSMFKALDGRITEQERDVFKWWKKCGIRISLFGLENQTNPDPDMCFKLYGYDGAAYKSQYGKKNKYPVISLVLYFDYKRHWVAKKSLCDSLSIPETLKPYVNDYHMNLYEIAWLSEEQVNMFRSDFKIVAEYFYQMRTNRDYSPSPTVIKHVDAILKLMSSLTGDSRFEDIINETSKSKKEMITMCEALDRIEKRGVKLGNFMSIIEIVSNYRTKKKLSQKAACEDLSIDYKEYLAAKRYMKKVNAGIN